MTVAEFICCVNTVRLVNKSWRTTLSTTCLRGSASSWVSNECASKIIRSITKGRIGKKAASCRSKIQDFSSGALASGSIRRLVHPERRILPKGCSESSHPHYMYLNVEKNISYIPWFNNPKDESIVIKDELGSESWYRLGKDILTLTFQSFYQFRGGSKRSQLILWIKQV